MVSTRKRGTTWLCLRLWRSFQLAIMGDRNGGRESSYLITVGGKAAGREMSPLNWKTCGYALVLGTDVQEQKPAG
jgi:hypothetical protein